MLPANPIDSATLEPIASWRDQDAREDPEELRAAEQELAEFKKSVKHSRGLDGTSAERIRDR